MGKKYRSQRNRNKNKKKQNEEKKDAHVPYEEGYLLKTVEYGNYKMEAYYALQGIHDTYYNEKGELIECQTAEEKHEERLRWRKSVTQILPASFRIAYDVSQSLKQTLEAELEALIPEEALRPREGEEKGKKAVLKKISFAPHAYQLSVDKTSLRKDPVTEKLHLWLKRQTMAGFITRQETVSMVPPVILAPEPDDVVFDMCAAPGSKTCQILEKLSQNGAIVANDANSQRAYMLVHQLRRIMHNNPVVLITSCEAQFFPQSLSFDRVLADVPCSGDGTSRKNIGIWKQWNQLGALALHSLQFDIAWKGCALLKVGGYICYSTCSQNPVENEAVVAELLRRANGSLELVDKKLEGFKTRPGISTWKVLAEEKSNRQMKNEQKKNNAKMRQRREEFEKKNEQEASVGDDKKEDGEKDTTSETNSEAAVDTTENETNEDSAESNKPRIFQSPDSWDEETLIGLAESAGLKYYKTVDDVPDKMKKRIRPSCFPPTEEEAKRFHLEKCLRCLPQDNDTGGFFTALLKKVGPISNKEARMSRRAVDEKQVEDSEPELKKAKPNPEIESDGLDRSDAMTTEEADDLPAGDDDDDDDDSNGQKPDRDLKGNRLEVNGTKKKHKDLGRDDFVPADRKILDDIATYYGFSEAFPKDQYMIRACGEAKVLYYIGKSVKENFIDKGIQKRVTIINSGVKGFVRNNKDTEGTYRISQEGVHFLVPYMAKRKIVAETEDFTRCLDGNGKPIELSEFSEEFSDAARSSAVGSLVVLLKGYENDLSRKMILTMWRCRGDKINCLVSKVEIDGMRSKLAAIKEEKASSS